MSEQLPHDEELRALYRKLPADEPRAEIDNAILAAAREQIHRKQRSRFLRRLGWTVPLAAAASIAITISLIRVAPEQKLYPEARLDEGFADAAAKRRAGGDSPVVSQPALPPAATPAPEADIDEAVGQKLKGLGYVDDSDVEAKNSASEQKRDEAQQPPQAMPAPPASPSARSADSSNGWKPMARTFENVDPVIAGALRERANEEAKKLAAVESDVKRQAEKGKAGAGPAQNAPAAPPPPLAKQKAATDEQAQKANDAFAKSESMAELHEESPSDSKDAPSLAASERRAPGDLARAQSQPEPLPGAIQADHADWPFRLEPGLDAHESCRRVVTTLEARCEFSRDTATVSLKEPARVDVGEFAGSKVSRLRLVLKNGKLWKVSLLLDGYKTEQVLVAPPEPAPK